MGIRIQQVVQGVAWVLLSGFSAACGPAYQAPLTLGSNTWIGYEPLYLARDKGYLDGLPLRLVELGSTSQVLDALRTGSLDLAGLTLDEALGLVAEGLPIEVLWVLNVSAGGDALVTREELATLADLRGLRIGVEQTAVGAYMLNSILQRAGLDAGQVQIIPLPLDEHLPAWRKGSVDALVTFDPELQVLRREGARLAFDSRALPGEIVDVLVARRSALECCRQTLLQLLEAQQRSLEMLAHEPQPSLSLMARRTGVEAGDIAAALATVELPGIAENQRLLLGDAPPLLATARRLASVMAQVGLLSGKPSVDARLFSPLVGELRP